MTAKRRNVLFVLLGAAALTLEGRYAGPFQELVQSHGGNVAAFFGVCFIVLNLPSPLRSVRLCAPGLALAVVELFEGTNGFGTMSNTYDLVDFAANAVGVVLVLALDAATGGVGERPERRIHG